MKKGEEILWLSEAEVRSLLSMPEAIEAMAQVFELQGNRQVEMPSKIYLLFDPFPGDLRAMPAFLKPPVSAAGVKIVNSNPANPEKGLPAVAGIMLYTDPETGLPLALMGAGTLTALRTGAAGGLAAKHLARPDSKSVGLVGCGRQAKTQLDAIRHHFKISDINVLGKTLEEAHAFIKNNPMPGVRCVPVSEVREAVKADIVVTTTPARGAVVRAEWIAPGTHINAIGADAPGKQELDVALIEKARVVVDEWNQASHAGELNVAVEKHGYTRERIAGELGEIVTGKKKGRLTSADITIFDSTGLAIQDVAAARVVFEKAVKLKKGQVLSLNG